MEFTAGPRWQPLPERRFAPLAALVLSATVHVGLLAGVFLTSSDVEPLHAEFDEGIPVEVVIEGARPRARIGNIPLVELGAVPANDATKLNPLTAGLQLPPLSEPPRSAKALGPQPEDWQRLAMLDRADELPRLQVRRELDAAPNLSPNARRDDGSAEAVSIPSRAHDSARSLGEPAHRPDDGARVPAVLPADQAGPAVHPVTSLEEAVTELPVPLEVPYQQPVENGVPLGPAERVTDALGQTQETVAASRSSVWDPEAAKRYSLSALQTPDKAGDAGRAATGVAEESRAAAGSALMQARGDDLSPLEFVDPPGNDEDRTSTATRYDLLAALPVRSTSLPLEPAERGIEALAWTDATGNASPPSFPAPKAAKIHPPSAPASPHEIGGAERGGAAGAEASLAGTLSTLMQSRGDDLHSVEPVHPAGTVEDRVPDATRTDVLAALPPALAGRQFDPQKEIENTLGAFDCARINAKWDPASRGIRLSGHVQSVAHHRTLLEQLSRVPGVDDIDPSALRIVGEPYCRLLAFLGRAELRRSDDQRQDLAVIGTSAQMDIKHYSAGTALDLTLRAPPFDSYIYVDYFSNDGRVYHLLPTEKPDNRFLRDEQVSIGGAHGRGRRAVIGAPFGLDVTLAIASSEALFASNRPVSEPAANYLAALDARMRQLGERGAEVRLEYAYYLVYTTPTNAR